MSKRILVITFCAGLGLVLFGNGTYLAAKALLAQYLLNQAWIESQRTGVATSPWSWADTKALAKITFVKKQNSFIVLSGSSGRTLAFAPGHLTGSAQPGNYGHSIISAHRDTHFSFLGTLNVDDIIAVERLDKQMQYYAISSVKIVDSTKTPLLLEPDSHLLTLISCYPFNAISTGGPLRYRVDAKPLTG